MSRRRPPAALGVALGLALALSAGGCAWWDSLWRDTLPGPYYKLNDVEKQAISWAFGEAVDADAIRLLANRTERVAPARAAGNVIFLRPGEDPEDEAFRATPEHLVLVVHEAAHVWQYQTRGTDYMVDAVSHNIEAFTREGDRGQAYVYTLTEDLDVLALRSEPQAKLIEEWYALAVHGIDPFRCLNWGDLGRTEYLRIAAAVIRPAIQAGLGENREFP